MLQRAVLVMFWVALAGTRGVAAPCKGCVLVAPAGDQPVPLVVILHGDRERAPAAAARWQGAIARRGWALLALECPADQGCKDSWWRWDGDPSWVTDQVAAVAQQRAIDPRRIYLIGWSGGASYIGWRASAWGDVFAALVLHGGGMPPAEAACPARAPPVYFLVGDKNPLHALAVHLRDYIAGCTDDVTWDLVAGADHAREEAALTAKKAAAILAWLEARPLGPATSSAAR
jgi:poly(3-hydroxybutyrate) depolymerase